VIPLDLVIAIPLQSVIAIPLRLVIVILAVIEKRVVSVIVTLSPKGVCTTPVRGG
jgi:hypothetical protein